MNEELTTAEQEALKAAEGAHIEDSNGNVIDTTPTGDPEQQPPVDQPEATGEAPVDKGESAAAAEQEAGAEGASDEVTALREALAAKEAEAVERQVFEAVGGQEAYQQMTQWAGNTMPDDQIEMYNEVMANGTASQKMFAVNALKAMYSLDMGVQGKTLGGDTPAAATGYTSDEEFYADLNNPMYHEQSPAGEAFRAKVMQRMSGMSTSQNMAGWVNA